MAYLRHGVHGMRDRKIMKVATFVIVSPPQPQVIIYINDNFEQILDFPRFYLYPHEWNRMHFTARLIELLEHPSDCTNKVGSYCRSVLYNRGYQLIL